MKNPFDLTGKTILVTGASSGIGRQTCISISNMGGNVIAAGRNQDRLNETLGYLGNGSHTGIIGDLTVVESRKCLTKNIPQLNGVVHCAGTIRLVPFKFYTGKIIREFYAINYEAPILLTQDLVKGKLLIKGASIIFISSIGSIVGLKGNGIYCGTKGALISTARTMALELASKSIRVNCISPGLVKTPLLDTTGSSEEDYKKMIEMHALGLGSTEDIANACIFLLSDAGRWITGSNLIVDGGYSIA